MSEFVTVITEVVAFTLGALGKGNNEKNEMTVRET
jgi:hypothetical protein